MRESDGLAVGGGGAHNEITCHPCLKTFGSLSLVKGGDTSPKRLYILEFRMDNSQYNQRENMKCHTDCYSVLLVVQSTYQICMIFIFIFFRLFSLYI